MKKLSLPDKTCGQCGSTFNRSRRPDDRLEERSSYESRRFCSHSCYGVWNTGTNNANYKDGMKRRPDGYVRYSDDRYVHRVVMEEKLGRPLEAGEIVHHIDEDPTNNDPENLEVHTNSGHRKMHVVEQGRDAQGRFAK